MVIPTGTPEEEAAWATRTMHSLIGRICNEAGIEEGDLEKALTHTQVLGELISQASEEQLEEVRRTLVEYSTDLAYEWGNDARTLRQVLYTHLISDNTYIDGEDPN